MRAHDREYSLPEICAFILQKLKSAAEDYLAEMVEEAVITVPAYFNDPQSHGALGHEPCRKLPWTD